MMVARFVGISEHVFGDKDTTRLEEESMDVHDMISGNDKIADG